MRTLREWRRAKLISIEDLAAKSGVSSKTIVETEKGRTTPRLRTMRLLSEALGVDPHEIKEFVASIEDDRTEDERDLAVLMGEEGVFEGDVPDEEEPDRK